MRVIIFIALLAMHIQHATALVVNKEPPVYYYTDHKKQLKELSDKLNKNKIVGVVGISGIGKSELIRKYVEINSSKYNLIIFIDANTDIPNQFVSVVNEINKIVIKDKNHYIPSNTDNIIEEIKKYLKNTNGWLLAFDNLHINQNDKINDFIEWSHDGHILVSSQDSNKFVAKVIIPLLNYSDTETMVNKIVTHANGERKKQLAKALTNQPPCIVGYSSIFIENNPHITVDEYIELIKGEQNKVQGHIKLVLKNLSSNTKEILNTLALIDNNKISFNLLNSIYEDKELISKAILELTRYGLIENIDDNIRQEPIMRMHDVVKKEILLLNIKNNKYDIEKIIDKLNNLIPLNINQRLDFIKSNPLLENTIEVLLNNADIYGAKQGKILQIRANMLWYYWIGIRSSHHTSKYVEWLEEHKQAIKLSDLINEEKASYLAYNTYVGSYYYIFNRDLEKFYQYYSSPQRLR